MLGTFEERPQEQVDIDSQVVDTSWRSELVAAVVQQHMLVMVLVVEVQ